MSRYIMNQFSIDGCQAQGAWQPSLSNQDKIRMKHKYTMTNGRTKIKGMISKIEIVRRNVTTDIIILYVGIKYVDFNSKSLKVN